MKILGINFTWPFRETEIYRKPILIHRGDGIHVIGGHFDLPSNDHASVTTGHAALLPEIEFYIVSHLINKTPLPQGIKLSEFKKSLKQLFPIAGAASIEMIDISRLPIWQGHMMEGLWDRSANGSDKSMDDAPNGATPVIQASPKTVHEYPEQPGEGALRIEEVPSPPAESTPVKITVVVNGDPSERLAARLNIPWRGELQNIAKRLENVFLPSELEFFIARARTLEEGGEKLPISIDKLLEIHGNLAMDLSKIATGKKKMSRFESLDICRVISVPKPDAVTQPQM